jgi:pantoate--beta-alanine ligase
LRIVTTISETREAIRQAKAEGKSIGFVPTMGALHAGHLKLMSEARRECSFVVVSIFVNPTQFGPTEDLAKYPRDLESDAAKCQSVGVDLIFAPTASDIYPAGFDTFIEVGGMTDVLEGASRPGHFKGVATVVAKLFNIVQPDKAYFGMKDYQQLLVIRKMARDLDFPTKIVPVATVREEDGLAMSSRNAYLSLQERSAATVLFRALKLAEAQVQSGSRNPQEIQQAILDLLKSEPLAIVDYAAVVDPETLTAPEKIGTEILIALALRIGQTRLIDNMLIELR